MKDVSKWEDNVIAAKALLGSTRDRQMKIAALAIEVCDISWGGGVKKGQYTLRAFAKDIGISEKTLSNWVGLKRRILDKLRPELRYKAKLKDLVRAAKTLGAEASSEEINKRVFDLIHDSGPDKKLVTYLCSLRATAAIFQDEAVVSLCKRETLEEVVYFCESIIKNIQANSRSKIKGKEHNLVSIYSVHSVNAVLPSDSRTWRMRARDKQVLDILYKKEGFIGPTKIGALLSGKKSNTSKLQVMRSANKLYHMGLVAKNERGEYKIKHKQSDAL